MKLYDTFDAILFGDISHCNIAFFIFRFSQGSVANLIRWGGWSSACYMCRSSRNLAAKTALKSLDFDDVTDKNQLVPFTARGVIISSSYFSHHMQIWPRARWAMSHWLFGGAAW